LAIKYGLHLDPIAEPNYLASDGTVVWGSVSNTGYTNTILGIGFDSTSGLNQKQSTSGIGADILTLSLSSTASSNASNQAIFGGDKLFLLVGNNGSLTGSITTSDLPTNPGTATPMRMRMARVWKAQNTNSVGPVELRFDLTGAFSNTVVYQGSELCLLIDKNNTGSFTGASSGTGSVINAATLVGGKVYKFSNITLNTGDRFTVGLVKKAQVLTFANSTYTTTVDQTSTIMASISLPTNSASVTYSVTSTAGGGSATVNVNTGQLTATGAGTVTLIASSTVTADYTSATTSTLITINKSTPVLSILSPLNMTVGSITTAVTSTTAGTLGGSSRTGGAVTFSISAPGNGLSATVNPLTGQLTATRAGTITLIAQSAGDSDYNIATTSTLITIGRSTPGLSLTSTTESNTVNVGGTLSITYTSIPTPPGGTVPSTGSVSFSVIGIGAGSATIDPVSGLLTAQTSGQVVVSGVQGPDVNYYQSTVGTLTISIGAGPQTLTFASSSYPLVVEQVATITATNNVTGGGTITYSVSAGSGSATVNPNTGQLTATGAGTVTLTAQAAANSNYSTSSTSTLLVIGRSTPTLQISSPTVINVGDITTAVTHTLAQYSGGGAVTFTIIASGSGSATVNPFTGQITATGAGSVTLVANSAGDTNYYGSTTSAVITINPGSQVLTLISSSGSFSVSVGNSITITTMSSVQGGATPTYSVSSGSVTINPTTGFATLVTGVGAGTVTLTATVASNTNYLGATTSTVLSVVQLPASNEFTIMPSSQSVLEGNAVSFTISRISSGTAITLTLNLASGQLSGTAFGASLVSNSVSFASGDLQKTVAVTTTSLPHAQGQYEYFTLAGQDVSGPLNSLVRSATLTVLSSQIPATNQFTMAPSAGQIIEGQSLSVTISRVASGTAVSISLTLTPGQLSGTTFGANLASSSVSFASGDLQKTVVISTVNLPHTTGQYGNFTLSGVDAGGIGNSSILPSPQFTVLSSQIPVTNRFTLTASQPQVMEGNSLIFTITRATSGSVVTINLSSLGSGAVPFSSPIFSTILGSNSVTFSSGDLSKTVAVNTISLPHGVGQYEDFTLSGVDAGGIGNSYIQAGQFEVIALANVISVNPPTTVAVGNSIAISTTRSVSAAQGGAVSYTLSSTGSGSATVDVSLGTLTGTQVGTVLLTVTALGGNPYPPTSVTQTISITIGTQALTITGLPLSTTVGSSLSVSTVRSVSSTFGGSLTYSLVGGSGSATIDASGNLLGVSAGSLTLTVTALGNTNYYGPISSTGQVTIGKGTPTLSITSTTLTMVVGSTATVSAQSIPPFVGGVSSTGSITYSIISGAGSATINSITGQITAIASGNIVVQATQGSDLNYNAPVPVSLTITIGAGPQTLALTSSTGSYITVVDGSLTVTASSNVINGGSITYSVVGIGSGSATVDVTSGFIFGEHAGSVVLTASTSGNSDYTGASITQTITIDKGSQTLTISPATSAMLAGSTLALSGTTSAIGGRGGVLVYDIVNGTGSATVTQGGLVTAISAGMVTFTVSTLGDSDYLGASTSRVITISKGPQTLTITSLSTTYVGGTLVASYTTTASASSGGVVTYQLIGGSGSATIDAVSGMLTGTRAGTVQLQATSSGDTNYNGAVAIQTLTIGRGTPTLSLLPLPPVQINVGSSTVVTATSIPPFVGGVPSTGLITYSIISGGAFASIDANTGMVTANSAGDIVVEATQSSDVNYYSPAPVSLTISISKGAQTLTITSINMMSVNGSLTVTTSSTAIGGGGSISYSIVSLGGIATIDPLTHVISATQGGQIILTASSAGDTNYLPASTDQTITIVSLSMDSVTSSLLEGTNGAIVLSLNPTGITLPVDVTFSLSGSGADAQHYSIPSSIVLLAGQPSVSIPVQAITDKVLYNSDTLVLNAVNTYLNSVSGTIGIDDATSLDASNRVVTVGNGSIFSDGTVQVKVSLPAGVTSKRPITVNITLNGSSEVSLLAGPPVVSSSVVIPVDSNFGLFDVIASSNSEQPAHLYLDGNLSDFTVNQGVVTVLHKKMDLVVALSNNGDGLNDCLTVQNIEKYPDNTVSIIDRRGILVYQGPAYDNGNVQFCGRSNQGRPYSVPSGPYYYTIRFIDKTKDKDNTQEEIYYGSFELRYSE
jgi:hypothetical protein